MVGRVVGGAQNVGTAVGNIVLNAAGVATGVSQASGHLRGFSLESIALVRGFTAVSDIGLKIGGGIAAGLALAVREFAKFEKSLRNVSSLGLDAGQTFESLKQSVLALAGQTAIAPTELADGLYDIRQAGFSAADSLTILTAAADAANAGLTSTKVAADLISSVILAYGLAAKDATNVSNILFSTVLVGKVTFEELARTMGFTLPTAKALGVSLEELGASFASLTNQGLSVRAAGNSINSILNTLIKPTKALSAAFAENGIESGQMLIATRGLGGAIAFLDQIAGGNVTTLQKFLGNQRSTRAELFLAANGAQEYTKALLANEKAQEGAGATAGVLKEQQRALAFQFKQAKTEITIAAIQIGEVLAPAASKAAGVIKFLAGVINDMNPSLRSVIVQGLGLVAVFGLTIGVTGRIISSVIRFSESMRLLRLGINASNTALAQQNTANAANAAGLQAAGTNAATTAAKFSQLAKFAGRTVALAVVLSVIFDLGKIATGDTGDSTLKKIGRGMSRAIAIGFEAAGKDDIAASLNKRIDEVESAAKVSDVAIHLGLKTDVTSTDFLHDVDIIIGDFHIRAQEVQELADQTGQSVEDLLVQIAKKQGVSTDEIDAITAVDDAQQDQNATMEESIKIGATAADTYADMTSKVDTLGKKLTEAEQAFAAAFESGLNLPLTNSPEALADFTTALDTGINKVLASVGALASAEDPLAFLRAQFGLTTKSATSTFLALEQLGVVDIFGGSDENVLKLVSNLTKVEQRIQAVTDEIQNNAEDMSMWQGRIDLVSGLFGSNQEALDDWIKQLQIGKITFEEFTAGLNNPGQVVSFDKLNALLDQGKLTKQEYDAAVEAGINILERSTGALQDEAAEQARLLPILDEYIAKHDRADKAVKELSDEQAVLANLLQDTAVQQALATVQMVTYLASIGQIPKSKATEVITNLANSDAKIATVLDLLELIPNEVNIEIQAQIDQAQQKLHEIQTERDALIARRAILLVSPETAETQAEIAKINDQLGFLNDQEATVKVAIENEDFTNPIFEADRALDGLSGTHDINVDTSGIPAEVQIIDDLLTTAIEKKRNFPPFFTQAQADETVAVIDQSIATLKTKLDDASAGRIVLDDSEIAEIQAQITALAQQKIDIVTSVDKDGSKAAELAQLNLQIANLKQQKIDIIATVDAEDAFAGINSIAEARRRLVETREQVALLPPSPETHQQLALIDSLIQKVDASNARAEVGLDPGDTLGLLNQIASALGTVADPVDLSVKVDTNIVEQSLADVKTRIKAIGDEMATLLVAPASDENNARIAELTGEMDRLSQEQFTYEIILNAQDALQTADKLHARIIELQDKRADIIAGIIPPPDGQTVPEAIASLDALIQNFNDEEIFIRTVVDNAEAQGLLDAAGKVTDPITIPIDVTSATEAFRALQDVDGIQKHISQNGTLVLRADSTQAIAEFEKVNNISLISRPDIKIEVNGEQVTALQARVANLFDILNENSTVDYTVFLKGDATDILSKADLAEKSADSVAKVYTAYFNADTTDFTEQVAFVESLLKTLGVSTANASGVIGINFQADPASALAVIQAINNDIDTKLLTPQFLVHLDANADGFLSAAELALASAEALTTDPFVATFLAKTAEADKSLVQTKGLIDAVTTAPNKVTITVDSAAAAQAFVDANKEQLAGKTILVQVKDESTGKIKEIVQLEIPPKEVVFNPVVNEEAARAAEEALERIRTGASEDIGIDLGIAIDGLPELDNLSGKVDVFQSIDGEVVTISVESEADALEFVEKNANALDGRKVVVKIAADEGTTTTDIETIKKNVGEETKTMPVDADTTKAQAKVDEVQKDATTPVKMPVVPGGATGDGTAEPTPAAEILHGPIVTPPADTTQTVKSLDGLVRVAGDKGVEGSAAFGAGFAGMDAAGAGAADTFTTSFGVGIGSGMPLAVTNAANGRDTIVRTLGQGNTQAQTNGESVGAFFAIGVAIGIAENAQPAYDNAAALGEGIHNSTATALQTASPSRRGMLLGRFWSIGVGIGVKTAAQQALNEARTLGEGLNDEFQRTVRPLSISSLIDKSKSPLGLTPLGVSQATLPQFVNSIPASRSERNTNLHAPISISGVSDPELASELAIRKLRRVFLRREQGVG